MTIPGILFLVSTIVILCGLLIPGYLLSSGIVKPYYGCGYSSPLSGLRTLLGVEATWRQGDYDRNGIKDYWTYDISGFNRMYRTDGETLVAAIDISFAEADGQSHDDVFIERFAAKTSVKGDSARIFLPNHRVICEREK